MYIELRIGRELNEVLLKRATISQVDMCFPLQVTRRELHNMLRRPADHPEALPWFWAGRNKAFDLEAITAWLLKRNQLLAIDFLRAWAEGRFDMPRPYEQDEKPPSLIGQLELLALPRPPAPQEPDPVFELEVPSEALEVRKTP